MDFFELMAECSVALGGFAAIHAALRGSAGPRGTFRAWGTVSWSFSAVLMALVPLLFATHAELDDAAWRAVHGVGLIPAGASMAVAAWMDHRLAAAGHEAQMRGFLRTAQGLGLFGCLLLLGALVGVPARAGATTYGLAVTTMFASGVIGIIASFWVAMREAMAPAEDAE